MIERTRSQCMNTHEWKYNEINCAVYDLNGIMYSITQGAYHEGNRNNTAVDLAICCYVMGIEDTGAIIQLLIDNCGFNDKEKQDDLRERLDIIKDYLWSWAQDGILEYMVGYWPKSNKVYIKVVD